MYHPYDTKIISVWGCS